MSKTRIALAGFIVFSAVCMAQRIPVEKWTDLRNWADLRSDMTETQVIDLLGQPKETTTSQTDSTNIWYYQQIPLAQTYKLCDGCVVFRKDSTGTHILYRWQDPNWKQVEADKKEKETALETAAEEAELERQAELAQKELERQAELAQKELERQAEVAQKELEQAESAKETPEPKLQSQEEARRMKAKMVAEFVAMEREQEEKEENTGQEHTAAHGGLVDRLRGMPAGYRFVLVGTVLLGIAVILIFKSGAGKRWPRREKKPRKHSAYQRKYNKQKYGIE